MRSICDHPHYSACGNVAENLYYCCNLKRVIYCQKHEIIFHSHTHKNFSYSNSDLKNIKKKIYMHKTNKSFEKYCRN